MLSTKASAEPGHWRTQRTPYLREPMDCLSASSPIERVVMMFGAQLCWGFSIGKRANVSRATSSWKRGSSGPSTGPAVA